MKTTFEARVAARRRRLPVTMGKSTRRSVGLGREAYATAMNKAMNGATAIASHGSAPRMLATSTTPQR